MATANQQYTLTKVRTFNGREGQGLNATICRNGKPICFVMDDASGGEVDYDFRNPKQNAASFQATTNEMAEREERELGDYLLSIMTAEEKAKLNERMEGVKSYSPQLKEEMWKRHKAIEAWVNDQVDEASTKKRFDRISKKKTLFRLKGDKKDEWRTISVPYSDPRMKDHMAKKYGDQVEQIWGVA